MFNPSREEVRRFFVAAWQAHRAGQPLEGNQRLAAQIAARHPEYHALLESTEAVLAQEFTPEQGESNPFLHLSLHLAIEEQLSIDQPPGIREHYMALLRLRGTEHAAQHEVLECLGEALWRAQRESAPPDGAAYLECLRRRAQGAS